MRDGMGGSFPLSGEGRLSWERPGPLFESARFKHRCRKGERNPTTDHCTSDNGSLKESSLYGADRESLLPGGNHVRSPTFSGWRSGGMKVDRQRQIVVAQDELTRTPSVQEITWKNESCVAAIVNSSIESR